MFLTGKKEITYMCSRLNMALRKHKGGKKRTKSQQEEFNEEDDDLLSFDGEVPQHELLDV